MVADLTERRERSDRDPPAFGTHAAQLAEALEVEVTGSGRRPGVEVDEQVRAAGERHQPAVAERGVELAQRLVEPGRAHHRVTSDGRSHRAFRFAGPLATRAAWRNASTILW